MEGELPSFQAAPHLRSLLPGWTAGGTGRCVWLCEEGGQQHEEAAAWIMGQVVRHEQTRAVSTRGKSVALGTAKVEGPKKGVRGAN